MEEQVVIGVILGAGSLAVGYILSRVSDWYKEEAEHLSQAPRYYNFSDLESHLVNRPDGTRSNILVQGTVRSDGSTLYSEKGGIDGAAKLVKSTSIRKVLNEETGQWNEKRNTLTNQCLSVPFRLVDRRGSTLIVENVHLASGFKSILELVYQSKDAPEHRTIGDFATGVTLNEIPTGTVSKEYMLLYGASFAAFGDAMQAGIGKTSRVVFYPTEVGHTIKSLIAQRNQIAQINNVLSTIFVICGFSLIVVATVPLIIKLWRERQRKQENSRFLTN